MMIESISKIRNIGVDVSMGHTPTSDFGVDHPPLSRRPCQTVPLPWITVKNLPQWISHISFSITDPPLVRKDFQVIRSSWIVETVLSMQTTSRSHPSMFSFCPHNALFTQKQFHHHHPLHTHSQSKWKIGKEKANLMQWLLNVDELIPLSSLIGLSVN